MADDQLVQLVVPLPIDVADPVERLERVRAATAELSDSGRAQGARAIAAAQGFAPPTILAQAARLTASTRLYNVAGHERAGPAVRPAPAAGGAWSACTRSPFLSGDRALAVAVMSYDGTRGRPDRRPRRDGRPRRAGDGIAAGVAELAGPRATRRRGPGPARGGSR